MAEDGKEVTCICQGPRMCMSMRVPEVCRGALARVRMANPGFYVSSRKVKAGWTDSGSWWTLPRLCPRVTHVPDSSEKLLEYTSHPPWEAGSFSVPEAASS